jgi:hypothetical protein
MICMFCLQLGTVLTETRTDHHVSLYLISLHATQHTSHTYCRDTSLSSTVLRVRTSALSIQSSPSAPQTAQNFHLPFIDLPRSAGVPATACECTSASGRWTRESMMQPRADKPRFARGHARQSAQSFRQTTGVACMHQVASRRRCSVGVSMGRRSARDNPGDPLAR